LASRRRRADEERLREAEDSACNFLRLVRALVVRDLHRGALPMTDRLRREAELFARDLAAAAVRADAGEPIH